MAETTSGKPWEYNIKCPECKNEVKFDASDIQYYEGSLSDSYDYSGYTAECPSCKSSIEIPYKAIPLGIKEGAKQKYRAKKKRHLY